MYLHSHLVQKTERSTFFVILFPSFVDCGCSNVRWKLSGRIDWTIEPFDQLPTRSYKGIIWHFLGQAMWALKGISAPLGRKQVTFSFLSVQRQEKLSIVSKGILPPWAQLGKKYSIRWGATYKIQAFLFCLDCSMWLFLSHSTYQFKENLFKDPARDSL